MLATISTKYNKRIIFILHYISDESVNGCDIKAIHNMSIPANGRAYKIVTKLCDMDKTRCSSDCMAFLKYELLSQPCFSGELYEYARAKANPVSDLSTANEDDERNRTEIVDWAQFYDIVDFCLHNSCGAVNVSTFAFLLTLFLITPVF